MPFRSTVEANEFGELPKKHTHGKGDKSSCESNKVEFEVRRGNDLGMNTDSSQTSFNPTEGTIRELLRQKCTILR